MLRFAERLEVRAVATNPVRYLVPEDAFLADALECMRKIVPDRAEPRHPRERRGVAEAGATRCARCSPSGRTSATPRCEIAETCTFDLGLKRMHFPDFPMPEGRSASSVLAERCWRGIERPRT